MFLCYLINKIVWENIRQIAEHEHQFRLVKNRFLNYTCDCQIMYNNHSWLSVQYIFGFEYRQYSLPHKKLGVRQTSGFFFIPYSRYSPSGSCQVPICNVSYLVCNCIIAHLYCVVNNLLNYLFKFLNIPTHQH